MLLREVQRSSTISIRGFYERRARRILPAGTVVLVATMLYAELAGGALIVAATAAGTRVPTWLTGCAEGRRRVAVCGAILASLMAREAKL